MYFVSISWWQNKNQIKIQMKLIFQDMTNGFVCMCDDSVHNDWHEYQWLCVYFFFILGFVYVYGDNVHNDWYEL